MDKVEDGGGQSRPDHLQSKITGLMDGQRTAAGIRVSYDLVCNDCRSREAYADVEETWRHREKLARRNQVKA